MISLFWACTIGLFIGILLIYLSNFFPVRFAVREGKHAPKWIDLFGVIVSAFLFGCLSRRLHTMPDFIFLGIICSFLVLIAMIDWKYRLVLNVLILPATVLMLLFQIIPLRQMSFYALLGGSLAFILFSLAAIVSASGIGGGDIKLAFFLGLTLGFPNILWALLVGVGLGGITAVSLLLFHNHKRQFRIPYAPFLCFGAILSLFYNPFL